jgi:NhaP-type Na+/H+ or K+/H+ antiporter
MFSGTVPMQTFLARNIVFHAWRAKQPDLDSFAGPALWQFPDMFKADFAVFLIIVFVYGLVSRRLRGTVVSSPMIFVSAGLFVGTVAAITSAFDVEVFLVLGEFALALTLFSDAARMNLSAMRGNDLPERMLAVGLPLTIAAGAAVAVLLFTNLAVWEAAILGTVLAPTDAGLGKQVVNDPRIPIRIREALNVEAGLNDGIAVPFLLIFISLAEAAGSIGPKDIWPVFAAQIGFGIVIGLVIGIFGAKLLKSALKRRWVTQTYRNLAFPTLGLVAFIAADALGGSGFIASFVGGLSAAWVFGGVENDLVAFIEAEGQIINLGVFFIFGALAVSVLPSIDVPVVVYALLSLTVIRIAPVAISLIGKELHSKTVLFLGWFGPRGLASIVLGLLVVKEIPHLPGLAQIQAAVTATVLLSIFAHGISTNPLINAYSKHAETLKPGAGEKQETTRFPARKATNDQRT